ncbi:MurR/RpiR family transcriptional regulator [Microvirga sp. ACRRW]|uniref:MurR/RpiR family transcriptional regulator n=1 Tax=Microvirga sp. ACRRW TaxID=2918205 RepID=UPI001EF741C6|nr:MurR/RpiR family transcriptional regulator [Microvirga sp. ACRRW]
MSRHVKQRLEESLEVATASGRAVASFMLANLSDLPFETSATIAQKIGVSELTVGRFCRSIGYRHLKDLKDHLRTDLGGSPWLLGDRLKAFQKRSRDDLGELTKSFELEVSALVRVYEYAQSPAFRMVSRRLATASRVLVAGFQTERGIAASFVHNLQYLRDNVQLLDSASGYFGEALLGQGEESALVIFEARRYSRQAKLLASKAHERGVPVTLVTDPYCDWADGCTSEVFRIPTDLNLFWESTAPMLSLVHLILNAVFNELGPQVEERLNATAALYHEFVGYTEHP